MVAVALCVLKAGNMAVSAMMKKPHSTKRRKFIDLRHQMLQHLVAERAIKIIHVRS